MQKLLTDLIRLENVSADIPANEAALKFCQAYLAKKGVESEICWHTDHPSLEWGAAPEQTRFLLNTHIDVVPAPKKCFQPQIKDGLLLGRGAADTKAMVAIFLSFSQAEYEQATRAGVRFVLVSDEEIGGDLTKALVEKLPKLKFGLFGEPTGLKLNNEAKGIMQVKLTAQGKNAHGSQPWEGENAILALTESLSRFLQENPLSDQYTWETTFSFSQIQGGTAVNQVPASCELSCDVRYKPTDSTAEILQKLERHFGKDGVEVLREESPIFTEESNHYLQLLARQLEAHKVKVEYVKALGSSDARHCTKLGIPTVIFGPIGDKLHQDDEWLDLSSLPVAKQVLADFLQAL